MKKSHIFFFTFIFLIILTGCSSSQFNSEELLKFYNDDFLLGANSNSGYYYIDKNKEGYYNIKYIDYNQLCEIYLCNNISCKHNSDTCNSWLVDTGGEYRVYCDDINLYLIHSGGNNNIDTNNKSYIKTITLSGEHKNNIIYLDDVENGVYISPIVFGDENYYFINTKTTEQENNINIKYYLEKVNINTGEETLVCDINGNSPILCGVLNNNFLIMDIDISDGYKNISRKIYSLSYDGKKIKELYSWNNDDYLGKIYKDSIYLFSRNTWNIQKVNLSNLQTTQLIEESKIKPIEGTGIVSITEKYVIGHIYENFTGKTYMLDLDTGNISYPNMEMTTSDSSLNGNIIQPISVFEDKFIVANKIYKENSKYNNGNNETITLSTIKYDFGYINIYDYINNEKNIIDIELIN